jgi:hypothetical protein
MNVTLNKRALACAALSLATVAGARASELPAMASTQATQMTAAQSAAHVRALTSGRAQIAAGKTDTTPPVLASFKVTAPADTSAPLAQWVVQAKAGDDLSGVLAVDIGLAGPHGQTLWVGWAENVHPKAFSGKFAYDASAYLEPGIWTVFMAIAVDAAGNSATYTGDTLAALGNTQVTVVNKHPELADFTAPAVLQGTVVTPSLSASALQKGTTLPPTAVVDFAVSDVGSGVMFVNAQFCLPDMSACLQTAASETVRGRLSETLRTGNTISGLPPGTYLLNNLIVEDQAGFLTDYMGADFGGETDFSTLMPDGHSITITP